MKSICLIDVYFGKLPKWINLFLETCKHNPTIDWIIFTDDETPKNTPENVRFIKKSMKQMNKYISDKLGLNITVKKGYKYCDIRPAFGHVFKTYLKKYDFWGHTDLDVLFGDIRSFMTDNLLKNHDVISSDKRKVCGPFTIFRNVKRINELYKELAPCYREIFENSDKHYHSNEQAMTDVVNKAEKQKRLKKSYRMLHKYQVGKYEWKDGKIRDKNSGEITMYVHLRKFKERLDPKPDESFEVNPQGFVGENKWVKEWEEKVKNVNN